MEHWNWISFSIGVIVGVNVGMFVVAIFSANNENREHRP